MDKWNLFFSIVETLKIGTMEIGDPMDVEDIKEKYFILVDIASSIEAFLEDQEKLFNFGREISLSRRSDSSLTREEWDSLQERLNNVQHDPELAELYSPSNDKEEFIHPNWEHVSKHPEKVGTPIVDDAYPPQKDWVASKVVQQDATLEIDYSVAPIKLPKKEKKEEQ